MNTSSREAKERKVEHIFTEHTPRPWGVRNTFSAIQRGNHGEFPAAERFQIPAGFSYPTYTVTKITRGQAEIIEDDDGKRIKRRKRDIVETSRHTAICSGRLVRSDGTEIVNAGNGWHVYGSNGRRVTDNPSETPGSAWNKGQPIIAAMATRNEQQDNRAARGRRGRRR